MIFCSFRILVESWCIKISTPRRLPQVSIWLKVRPSFELACGTLRDIFKQQKKSKLQKRLNTGRLTRLSHQGPFLLCKIAAEGKRKLLHITQAKLQSAKWILLCQKASLYIGHEIEPKASPESGEELVILGLDSSDTQVVMKMYFFLLVRRFSLLEQFLDQSSM